MFDYGVCFGGMLRGYASGYASRSVKTKVVAFPEGMLQGMLRGYASGYASPKSNIPVLHRLDTLKKDKPILFATSEPWLRLCTVFFQRVV